MILGSCLVLWRAKVELGSVDGASGAGVDGKMASHLRSEDRNTLSQLAVS